MDRYHIKIGQRVIYISNEKLYGLNFYMMVGTIVYDYKDGWALVEFDSHIPNYKFTRLPNPQLKVDLTRTIDIKVSLLQIYEDEIKIETPIDFASLL